MSNISIQVEFLAGTSLEQAIIESRHKSMVWDVAYVKFNFNGVNFFIGRNCDTSLALKEYTNAKTGDSLVYY